MILELPVYTAGKWLSANAEQKLYAVVFISSQQDWEAWQPLTWTQWSPWCHRCQSCWSLSSLSGMTAGADTHLPAHTRWGATRNASLRCCCSEVGGREPAQWGHYCQLLALGKPVMMSLPLCSDNRAVCTYWHPILSALKQKLPSLLLMWFMVLSLSTTIVKFMKVHLVLFVLPNRKCNSIFNSWFHFSNNLES